MSLVSKLGSSFAFIAVCASGLAAEDEPRDMLTKFLAPTIEARYGYDFPMPFESLEGSFSMFEYRLSVPLKPVQTSELVVLKALSYRLYDTEVSSPGLSDHHSLNTVRMPIEAIWRSPSSPWLGVLYFEPGLSTDFKAINSNSLDLSLGVGAGYRFSESFVLALGVAYSRNYGEDLVFPGFAMLWAPCDQFAVSFSPDGLIPEWRINDGLHIKLKAAFLGGRWTVEDDNGRAREIILRGGTATLEVEKRLFKQCWLSASAGTNILANLQVNDSYGDAQLDQDLKPALVLSAGVKWQF